MNTNRIDDGRRCSLIILISTVTFILITVIVGICVRFLVPNGNLQNIILVVLICVLSVVGVSAIITLELRRRRFKKIAKKAKPPQSNGTAANYKLAATAPPISEESSWNYKNYSNRTTIQA